MNAFRVNLIRCVSHYALSALLSKDGRGADVSASRTLYVERKIKRREHVTREQPYLPHFWLERLSFHQGIRPEVCQKQLVLLHIEPRARVAGMRRIIGAATIRYQFIFPPSNQNACPPQLSCMCDHRNVLEHVFLMAVQRGCFGRAIQRGRAAGKGSLHHARLVGRALQGVHSADCGDRVASTALRASRGR